MAGLSLRRESSAEDVLAVARPLEPASTRLVADVRRRGIGRDNRVISVVDGDGTVLGMVAVTRLCADRWYASPLVLDEAAAPLLASAIETGPTRTISGTPEHVVPLLAHLQRAKAPMSVPYMGAWVPNEPPVPPDDRTRLATAADLDGIVEVYARDELEAVPTKPRIRRFVRRALAEVPVTVAEVDGRIVGAMRLDWPTERFAFWWGLTVLEEHRGTGLGNSLLFRSMAVANDMGLCMVGTIGPTNPMVIGEGSWEPLKHRFAEDSWATEWVVVNLKARSRFPGERRMWALLERVEGRR